jgi:hypothetical protein
VTISQTRLVLGQDTTPETIVDRIRDLARSSAVQG